MTPRTIASRDATLGFIEAAESLLYRAAEESSDLRGWVDEWHAIGRTADKVKELRRKIQQSPAPTGHASEP